MLCEVPHHIYKPKVLAEKTDAVKKVKEYLKDRKCWFCERKCYEYVSICEPCKSDRIKRIK